MFIEAKAWSSSSSLQFQQMKNYIGKATWPWHRNSNAICQDNKCENVFYRETFIPSWHLRPWAWYHWHQKSYYNARYCQFLPLDIIFSESIFRIQISITTIVTDSVVFHSVYGLTLSMCMLIVFWSFEDLRKDTMPKMKEQVSLLSKYTIIISQKLLNNSS